MLRNMEQTNNDFKSRNFTLTKFPTPQTFSCWKLRFRDWSMLLFNFPYGSHIMDQRSSCRYFSGRSKIFVFHPGNYSFSWFELFEREDCISPEQKIFQNFYFKKKVSLEEHKAQKADRFLRGRQIAYLIYDSFWISAFNDVTIPYQIMSTYSRLTMTMTHSNEVSTDVNLALRTRMGGVVTPAKKNQT